MKVPAIEFILRNVSLRPYNTFGLDANAEYFAPITHPAQLQAFVLDSELQALPKFILGGGSNILLAGDVRGLVMENKITGRWVVEETADQITLAVGGGENWHELVLWTLSQNWGGLENLSLIPGKVGAAPIQNIGAYGVEIKDVFSHLRAVDLETGEIQRFGLDECQFGYRDSIFKRELKGRYAIVEVAFHLRKAPHTLHTTYGAIGDELTKMGVKNPTIQDVSQAVIAIRQSKLPDPAQIGNAGSFFKNPEIPLAQFLALKEKHPQMPAYDVDLETKKIPAGWLIEQAGWKGKRFGNYGVHVNQALVLVNYGGASGADIYALSGEILADVLAKFGVTLEREVNVVGGE